MVDNSKVCKQVKRIRKEKQKENARNNKHPGMLVKCLKRLFEPHPNSSTSDEEDTSESSSQTGSPSLFAESDIEQGGGYESSSPAPVPVQVANLNPLSAVETTDLPPSEMGSVEGIIDLEAAAPISPQEQTQVTAQEEEPPPSIDLEYPILVRQDSANEEEAGLAQEL
jgi:hypothetical protein